MHEILMSIIVPVYNVQDYLEQCMDSIMQQSYRNYEVILIDDGSTDDSGYICDTYQKQDRVNVIHKANGGLSDARNTGLDIANGDYILFLDSDDYWNDPNFLKYIYVELKKNRPDILIYGYSKLYETKMLQQKLLQRYYSNIGETIENDQYNICAWDKVVKKDLIDEYKIRFTRGVCSEDMEWCAMLFKYATTCSTLSITNYVYRQRIGSITKTISRKNIDDVMLNYQKCLKLQQGMNIEKEKEYNFYLAKNLSMFMIALAQLDRTEQKEYYPFIRKNLEVLRFYTRKRELYIYLICKMIGIRNTEYLLRIVSERKR